MAALGPVQRSICDSASAAQVLARCNAAAAREGRPAPIALEAGLGLLRDYYEANPEVAVAETAARCVRRLAAYPFIPDDVEIDWTTGVSRCALGFGYLLASTLGALLETEGTRFDPYRALALYHRAIDAGVAGERARECARDIERRTAKADPVRMGRWTARLARVALLTLRLSEHSRFDRDRFAELLFEILPMPLLHRLCRRAGRRLR